MHRWTLSNSAIPVSASFKKSNPLEQIYMKVAIDRIVSFIEQFPEAYLFCDGDWQIAEIKFDDPTD